MSTLLDRFLRYVRIDSQADERSSTYPSTPGQLELGKLLRDELLAIGCTDAEQNSHGIVFATIPGTVPGAPTIAITRCQGSENSNRSPFRASKAPANAIATPPAAIAKAAPIFAAD